MLVKTVKIIVHKTNLITGDLLPGPKPQTGLEFIAI